MAQTTSLAMHKTADSTIKNPQSYFHTLVLIGSKPTDFFLAFSEIIRSHLGTQLVRATRKSFEGSNGPETCFSNEVERTIHISTNRLLINSSRIDSVFVQNFW